MRGGQGGERENIRASFWHSDAKDQAWDLMLGTLSTVPPPGLQVPLGFYFEKEGKEEMGEGKEGGAKEKVNSLGDSAVRL